MTALAIIAGRLLQFAGILVLFGSVLFFIYGFAAGEPEQFSRRLRWPRTILVSAAWTGVTGVVIWLMAQTASVYDETGAAFNPALLYGIATETRFGRVCLLRVALLAGCLLVISWTGFSRPQWCSVAGMSGVVVATLAWTGHGIKDEGLSGFVHLTGDLVHLFSAGVWLGALVPLTFLIWQSLHSKTESDAMATYGVLECFSAIGAAVVAVLIVSGIINSWFLIGWRQPIALVTTVYGVALSVKLVLFGFMLLLAANNRYRLTPQLAEENRSRGQHSTQALRTLRLSLVVETGLGLLVLAAVAFLGTLEPPISAMNGAG